jgi:hypothetical protein
MNGHLCGFEIELGIIVSCPGNNEKISPSLTEGA